MNHEKLVWYKLGKVPDYPMPKLGLRKSSTEILKEVADEYGVTIPDLRSPRRQQWLCRARDDAMWRLQGAQYNLPEIGRRVNRDHSAVYTGIGRHVNRILKATSDSNEGQE